MTPKSAGSVFNAHLFFNKASKFDRAKIYVPNPVVNLFKPNVLSGASDADINPVAVPTDAAVEADIARLEVSGIFQGQQFLRKWSRAGLINRSRGLKV